MIKAIFAVDHWGGMGFRGTLPWQHHPEDMKYFKAQTDGQVVVMGRKTWDDPKMPKPLPNRISYIVTHSPIRDYKVNTIRGDIAQQVLGIQERHPNKTVWVIGGPGILNATRDIVSEVHVTHFKGQYMTDTKIDLRGYLSHFRVFGAKPCADHQVSWMVYRNLDLFKY